MELSTLETRIGLAGRRKLPLRLALICVCAGLLSACETTGSSGAGALAAKPPEPPMTRARAATECWMKTEKGSAGANIDKRADTVTKCIDDKMKAAHGPPKV